MYRVELKVLFPNWGEVVQERVPNVPCGVESKVIQLSFYAKVFVPNVPCGVERVYSAIVSFFFCPFLMYRVELKVYALRGIIR